jgi:antitoxin (DNA-binding transcriptional repressor) of toxin-antitoxin stability system
MIEDMVRVHMTEAEAARDFHAVLARVREGAEVVIEEGRRRIALVKPPETPGRPIDECIAIARARGSQATLDEDFARDLEEIVAERKPLDTSAWE